MRKHANYKTRPYSKEVNFPVAAKTILPQGTDTFLPANALLFVSDTENQSPFVQPNCSSLFKKSRLSAMRFQPMSSH
jgi:hypothetical protein